VNPPTTRENPSLPFAVAEPSASFLPLTGEAQEIVEMARSGLRRLRGRPSAAPGAVRDPNFLKRILARLRGGPSSDGDARALLGEILVDLDSRIEHFITLASIAGSPGDYQQELRTSRLALLALLDEGADTGSVSVQSYKTLTHVVDLVDLTRRDIERRAIERPLWAARLVLSELPLDESARVAAVVGAPVEEIANCASGKPSLSQAQLHRLQVVAQLVYDLRYSHTPIGLLNWFEQPFEHLGGRSPLELLGELTPDHEKALREYARSLRVQTAT